MPKMVGLKSLILLEIFNHQMGGGRIEDHERFRQLWQTLIRIQRLDRVGTNAN